MTSLRKKRACRYEKREKQKDYVCFDIIFGMLHMQN